MHRIASGTTLGVLPISTRRGVAVSSYDVKADTRAILADIIINKMCASLVLLHLYRDGIAAKNTCCAPSHPAPWRKVRAALSGLHTWQRERWRSDDKLNDNTIYI